MSYLDFRKTYTKLTVPSGLSKIDFVFNDQVFFPNQLLNKIPVVNTYYETLGDINWGKSCVFLEGKTVSFKYYFSDNRFVYPT